MAPFQGWHRECMPAVCDVLQSLSCITGYLMHAIFRENTVVSFPAWSFAYYFRTRLSKKDWHLSAHLDMMMKKSGDNFVWFDSSVMCTHRFTKRKMRLLCCTSLFV